MPLIQDNEKDIVRLHALGAGQTNANGATPFVDLTTEETNTDPGLFVVDLAANSITVTRTILATVAWSVRFSAGAAGSRYSAIYVDGQIEAEDGGHSAGQILTTGNSVPMLLEAGSVVKLGGYVDGGDIGIGSTAKYHTQITIAT